MRVAAQLTPYVAMRARRVQIGDWSAQQGVGVFGLGCDVSIATDKARVRNTIDVKEHQELGGPAQSRSSTGVAALRNWYGLADIQLKDCCCPALLGDDPTDAWIAERNHDMQVGGLGAPCQPSDLTL
ncbi:hypothetical protein MSTO_23400 [Mycobacterium stomatepiae]|uniref:Uncharacterized protein n=1 Tax=Mycobacterium stomatepiae TaxID=470076 RepID=A0A7I7Q701_9MYCO|nr:hypothetical protein MSTO_23400 [Mycobacterium stomatepiae]